MALSAVRLGTPGNHAAGAAATVLYTVPAGKRAILRDLRVYKNQTTGGPVGVRVTPGAAGGAIVYIFRSLSMPEGTTGALEDAFIVCEAGDKVELLADLGQARAYLSGHEFTL